MSKKISKKVIVIGGSDPSGGAGIQADLYTLQQLKVPAASVITAITAQNEKKFLSYQTVSPKNFQDQLKSISPFAKNSTVKIGMLGSSKLIPTLQKWLKKVKPTFILLDPVFRSTTKSDLIDSRGIELLKRELIHSVDLLLPNLSELSILSEQIVTDLEKMKTAARKILNHCSSPSRLKWILAKGGHLQHVSTDLLISKDKTILFKGKKIKTKEVHGTGCTLASAIAGYLWKGKNLKKSILLARKMVLRKINSSH